MCLQGEPQLVQVQLLGLVVHVLHVGRPRHVLVDARVGVPLGRVEVLRDHLAREGHHITARRLLLRLDQPIGAPVDAAAQGMTRGGLEALEVRVAILLQLQVRVAPDHREELRLRPLMPVAHRDAASLVEQGGDVAEGIVALAERERARDVAELARVGDGEPRPPLLNVVAHLIASTNCHSSV